MKHINLCAVLIILCALPGCKSVVQLLPSTDCEYVKYERVQNHVHAEVDCVL